MTGPVIVTRHGRARVVLVSADDYVQHWRRSPGSDTAQSQALEVSRAAILNHLSEAFVSFDADLRVSTVNPAFEDLALSTASQLEGKTTAEALPGLSRVFEIHLKRTLLTGEMADFDAPSETSARIHRIRTFPYPDGVAALIATRLEDQDLDRHNEHLRALARALEAIPQAATATLNVRGVFQAADGRFSALTGMQGHDLAGVRLSDIVRPAARHEVVEAVEACLSGGQARCLRTNILADGDMERPIMLSLSAITQDAAAVGLCVIAFPA